eukprot:974098-Pelagomonas_calceolata.AAC.1
MPLQYVTAILLVPFLQQKKNEIAQERYGKPYDELTSNEQKSVGACDVEYHADQYVENQEVDLFKVQDATDQIGHLKAWQYELLAHIFPRIVRKSIIFQFEGSFEKEMQETHIQGLGQP